MNEKVLPQVDDWIAVFDSGVGGVSVLRQLVQLMPSERYLYFGDSANAPYGVRPTEEIRELTIAVAQRLMARGCKALVVACNTATAAAIIELRQMYPDRIIIGIEPALKVAADYYPNCEVGVMATPVTLREEKFTRLMERFEDVCKVHLLPAPGLVELVEQDKAESAEMEALLTPLLAPYRGQLAAVVLGCTHYPFASAVIQKLLGEGTILLEGGPGTARETRRRLAEAGLLREGTGEVVFENSAGSEKMTALCQKLLHTPSLCKG